MNERCQGLGHVAVYTRDIEESITFYEKLGGSVKDRGGVPTQEGEKKLASLISGFITILPDTVTIMAEVAEWPDDIDFKRAEEARVRAERRLSSGEAGLDTLRAEMALKRALVRLELR